MTVFSDDFSAYSSKLWKQKIQFELQGKDYNNAMLSVTNEGITIPPFCHINTIKHLQKTQNKISKLGCEIDIVSEEIANKVALLFIEEGITVLFFKAENPFDYRTLFKGLLGKNITFHFNNSFLSSDFITELNDFLKGENVCYNVDIIGNVAKTGNGHTTLKNDFKIIEQLLPNTPNLLGIQADIYENAGANCVQQIAYALSHANEYFAKYGGAIPQITFHFGIGSRYFMEIAKLKAFRLLWEVFTKEYQAKTKAIIVTVPSNKKQPLKLEINDFRQKVMTEIALFGGADYVLVNDAKNEFLEEASNSYFIDYLTVELAKKSFELFKLLEKSGGFLQQLKKGSIQKKIRENAQKEPSFLEKETIRKVYNPIKTLFEPILPKSML